MDFLDRHDELSRLRSLSSRKKGGFAVVYGRRRIGKSCLLMKWCKETGGLYLVADTSSAALQRQALAIGIAERFPGFDEVLYPSWSSLLRAISQRGMAEGWHGPVVFDEFPYLVASDSSLPGVFQSWIDAELSANGLLIAISGSSQHMMQGLVLDRTSPLYGRAESMFSLAPLAAGHLQKALHLSSSVEAIKAYSVWGGVPRYWQSAEPYGSRLDESLEELVLSPLGLYHEEANYLLRSESPSAIGLRPYLDAIGFGAHRISELAARLQQPATAMSRPIGQLKELGLVRREIPFGENEHNSKRTLYIIDDPFCHFWFRVLGPRRSLFDSSTKQGRLLLWRKYADAVFAFQWEDLARKNVHKCPGLLTPGSDGQIWMPARRWWQENHPEWDMATTNLDGSVGLLGEVKWSDKPFTAREISTLSKEMLSRERPPAIPAKTIFVLVVPSVTRGAKAPDGVRLLTADDILAATLS